jgi:hypothetical protein
MKNVSYEERSLNGKRRKVDMPLTKKGKKIKSAMTAEYGADKGEKVFYASKNAGKIKGVDKAKAKKRKGK